MSINQAELDAAYKAAREAIIRHSPFYNSMISDEILQSIIAPAVRAAIFLYENNTKKVIK